MAEKIEFVVLGLDYSKTSHGAYLLVLSEKNGRRKLPVIIGSAEAQSIAIVLENMKPQRPFTHDIFKSVMEAFEIKLKEVHIYNLVDGIFYAKMICFDGFKEVELDSRSSDAIAMAIRFGCPIFVYDFIVEKASVLPDEILEEEQKEAEVKQTVEAEKPEDAMASLSVEELMKKLEEALENEEYELASKIRDVLNSRKGNA